MALPNLDHTIKLLVADESHKLELLKDTYLNNPLESNIGCQADTFAAFPTTEICGITILNIPCHFIPFAEYDKSNNHLITYWTSLAKLCEDPTGLPKQIKQIYTYYEIITLLDGYPNIKEYLNCAMNQNAFLWNQFSESLLEAVKEISGPEGNIKSYMDVINLKTPSYNHNEEILRFINVVTRSLEEKNWSTNMNKFFVVNQKFLMLIHWSLQHIGLVSKS